MDYTYYPTETNFWILTSICVEYTENSEHYVSINSNLLGKEDLEKRFDKLDLDDHQIRLLKSGVTLKIQLSTTKFRSFKLTPVHIQIKSYASRVRNYIK